MKIEITKENYTLKLVRENLTTAYVFTENAYSLVHFKKRYGGGSALIRPEPNAFGIVTKKKYDYDTRENLDYSDTDEDFKEFIDVNIKLIESIKNCGKQIAVFPKGFATDKAKMPTRFAEWLKEALEDEFGLITELNENKTGLICQKVI